MRITTKRVWNLETGETLIHEWYEWDGQLAQCCSSGDQTASSLEKTQSANSQTVFNEYQQMLAQNQSVLANLNAKLNYEAANPLGLTQPQMAGATTAINENTARAAQQAAGAAAAYGSARMGADVGSGATGQIAGEIYSGAAQSKAQQLAALSRQNEALKQENFWRSISGLGGVASGYGESARGAGSESTSMADASVNAGKLALQSQQATWGDIGGIISGVAGLGMAGAGAYKDVASAGAAGG